MCSMHKTFSESMLKTLEKVLYQKLINHNYYKVRNEVKIITFTRL